MVSAHPRAWQEEQRRRGHGPRSEHAALTLRPRDAAAKVERRREGAETLLKQRIELAVAHRAVQQAPLDVAEHRRGEIIEELP